MLFYIIKFNYIHDKSLILILPIWLNNKYCICMSSPFFFPVWKSESHLYKDVILTKKIKRNLKNAQLSMKFSIREDQLHSKKAEQQTMRVISYVNDRQKSN